MAGAGSVTTWLGQLEAGDHDAAQRLWERYFQRLVGLARAKLQNVARRVADEEDVALSAFDSFCRRAQEGRLPQLSDRDDLWRCLVILTAQKAVDLVRRQRAQKRGGGLVASAGEDVLGQVIGREPSPEFAAQVADEFGRLFALLGKDKKEPALLQSVAQYKLEGLDNNEIAANLGCVPRTVERKVKRIRRLWEKGGEP